MCGLAGYLPGNQGNANLLEEMLDALAHRGPNERNTYYSNAIAVGHHRLSVIDLDGGKQPRADQYGNVLAFNGEIYNYKALAKYLFNRQEDLVDHSDTEVLFCLIRSEGIESTLKKIEGMFAFAYYDAHQETLYLARDKFGEKPLYYIDHNSLFGFASEIGALRANPLFNKCQLAIDDCQLFLALEYLPGDRTGFKHIKELLPGHYLSYKQRLTQTHAYWSIADFSIQYTPSITGETETLTELAY